MKKEILSILLVLSVTVGWTQNLDSLIAAPQVIKLTISTPQPRINETFQLSLDINHLRANIFRSLAGKVRLSNDVGSSGNDELTMNVTPMAKGKNEIGPLEFYVNKTKYTTNKLVYEAIDPLPNTDRGFWLRKVMTSDTTFCIIIEQRIPAKGVTKTKSDNSISLTTEPETDKIAKFKDSYSIDGLSGLNSTSSTNFSSVEINGEDRQYMSGYSVYYFNIEDRKAKIKITKDKLENLPDGYIFKDIIIQ